MARFYGLASPEEIWLDFIDAIQFIHAEVPRPPLDKAYDKLLEDYGDWDAADPGYFIDEVLEAEGLDDTWEEDWETDDDYRPFIRAQVAKYHWSLVRKAAKIAPIVKYWFDVTMHNKYAPGGVGYFQAKADFQIVSGKRAREA